MPSGKRKVQRRPAAPSAQAKPDWLASRALRWLEAHALLVAVGLIALGAARIVAAYPENGITYDEPGHMACGLQFLAQHVYRYESQHPPLARVMSALGPFLDGARPMGVANQDQEGVAVLYRNQHVLRTLVLMRLGILPFFLLASGVAYFWSNHYFGKLTAVIATGLFTMLPPVLAHAGLATTDMPLAASVSAAFLALVLWAEKPGVGQSVWLGVLTGLAVLSKFTALAFLPAAAVLAGVIWVVVERPALTRLAALAKVRAVPFAMAALACLLMIWGGYLFSFGKVPGWDISLPAPELFDGILSALHHNEQGHVAYLLGRISTTGWWYYFPVVIAVKTPLAFLALVGLGLHLAWKHRRETVYLLPLAFALGVLLPAMAGRINIGVRHILPIYTGLSITAAVGLGHFLKGGATARWKGAAAAVCLIWMAGSGAVQHPDYLGYFNELVGSEPENVLVDSDLDWGQGTVNLARQLRQMGIGQVSFMDMNLTGARLEAWPGIPAATSIDPVAPVEGWTVVGPTFWKLHQYGLDYRYPKVKPWFESLRPVRRVGSFLLYYVPPGSLPAGR